MKLGKIFKPLSILIIITGFSFSVFASQATKVKSKWMKERKAMHAVAQKRLKANPDFKDLILKKYNEDKVAINSKYKKLFAEAKKAMKKSKMAAKKSKKMAKRSKRSRSISSVEDNSPVMGAERMEWVNASNTGMYEENSRRKHYNRQGYRLPSNVNVLVEEHDF